MPELQDEQLKNPEESNKKALRIIHIEDQEQVRNLIGLQLKKFPEVELVASFSSTEEAKDYLIKLRNEKQALPDGIVSDNNLGLGKVTGIQFAKDLMQEGFRIPVVLFTGNTDQYTRLSEERLNRMGLKSIVDKNEPESAKNLVNALKSVKSLASQDKPQ